MSGVFPPYTGAHILAGAAVPLMDGRASNGRRDHQRLTEVSDCPALRDLIGSGQDSR